MLDTIIATVTTSEGVMVALVAGPLTLLAGYLLREKKGGPVPSILGGEALNEVRAEIRYLSADMAAMRDRSVSIDTRIAEMQTELRAQTAAIARVSERSKHAGG